MSLVEEASSITFFIVVAPLVGQWVPPCPPISVVMVMPVSISLSREMHPGDRFSTRSRQRDRGHVENCTDIHFCMYVIFHVGMNSFCRSTNYVEVLQKQIFEKTVLICIANLLSRNLKLRKNASCGLIKIHS